MQQLPAAQRAQHGVPTGRGAAVLCCAMRSLAVAQAVAGTCLNWRCAAALQLRPSKEPSFILIGHSSAPTRGDLRGGGCVSGPVEESRRSSHLFEHTPCALAREARLILHRLVKSRVSASMPDAQVMIARCHHTASRATLVLDTSSNSSAVVGLPSGASKFRSWYYVSIMSAGVAHRSRAARTLSYACRRLHT